jgi:cell division transport system permease protein
MSFLDTKRIIKSGFTNFTRNGIISLASVLVVTITICVITSLVFLQAILTSSLSQIKDKVDVTVYFTTNANEDKILELKASLEKMPEVRAVTYISSDEALKAFRARHENDYLTIQALDELKDNPLGASLNIKAQETSQYEAISKYLENNSDIQSEGSKIIDKINYNQNKVIIDKLNSIIDGAQRLGFAITLVLVIISILITFNTIRLTIYISREEISIMRLVGAANKYIRGPFIVEGILYGLIASIVTLGIFYPLTMWLGNHMSAFLGMNLYTYYINNFFEIAGIAIVSGTFLGIVSSSLAIRRYLKK